MDKNKLNTFTQTQAKEILGTRFSETQLRYHDDIYNQEKIERIISISKKPYADEINKGFGDYKEALEKIIAYLVDMDNG